MIILKLNDQQKRELLHIISYQKEVLERLYVFEMSRNYDDILLLETESRINSMQELLDQLTCSENAAFEITEKGMNYEPCVFS